MIQGKNDGINSCTMGIGKGAVYCYDAIGSFERERYRTSGSASALIQPFLDNQV